MAKSGNSSKKTAPGSGARGPQLRNDHTKVILEECYKHGILGDGCLDGKFKETRVSKVYQMVAAAVNRKMPAINAAIIKAAKTPEEKNAKLAESVTGPQCKRKFKDAGRAYKRVCAI